MTKGSPHTVRFSRDAWASVLALCHADLLARGMNPRDLQGPSPQLPEQTAALRRELGAAGVVDDDGRVKPSWSAALGQQASAPVRAVMQSRHGEVSGSTRLTIVDDRALLVHHRFASRVGSDGSPEVGLFRDVVVSFARVQDVWLVLREMLPALSVLRAAPEGASGRTVATVVTAADVPALTGEISASHLPLLARRLAEDEEASVAMIVEAWPTPDRAAVRWSRLWAVAGGELMDVSIHGDGTAELRPEPAGAVASELQWALWGAAKVSADGADDAREARA